MNISSRIDNVESVSENKQGVCILGSTGTVGEQTLDVILNNPSLFYVHTLCANKSVDKLIQQCLQHRPKFAIIRNKSLLKELQFKMSKFQLEDIQLLSDDSGIYEAIDSEDCDIVMSAIVGAAGLLPTQKAIQASKKVLIANKEPLVMVGDLLIDLADKHKATILPVDSEHNAIFQCLPGGFKVSNENHLLGDGVRKLLLTGSGGPFREKNRSQLLDISVEEACAHPNWVMGPKISIDSATMMNKSLELIEACSLFNLSESYIDIVIHPESIIHSMVEYNDGSVIAQMAVSDMKVPIANAMSWPKRIVSDAKYLDFYSLSSLHFSAPDITRFPSLGLAREVARVKGYLPTVFNAANEMAVSLFLQSRIRFVDIVDIIDKTLEHFNGHVSILSELNINRAIEFDQQVRQWVLTNHKSSTVSIC